MITKAAARRTMAAPVKGAWRTIGPHLPTRLADQISTTARSGLRSRGLLSSGVTHKGGMRIEPIWPGVAEQLSDRIRVETFSKLLGEGQGRSILDLGAGPCHFSRRARSAGWKVTAVDARTERLPDDLEGIRFVQSDVRAFDPAGFDTIAILGLLYHLPVVEQERLLAACAYTRVILETQVHTPGFVPPGAEPWGRRMSRSDGLRGIFYTEKDNPQASVGNPTSFWATEKSLLKMFSRCGFRSVKVVQPAHYSLYGTRKFFVLE